MKGGYQPKGAYHANVKGAYDLRVASTDEQATKEVRREVLGIRVLEERAGAMHPDRLTPWKRQRLQQWNPSGVGRIRAHAARGVA